LEIEALILRRYPRISNLHGPLQNSLH
jgi:hypothetical protein